MRTVMVIAALLLLCSCASPKVSVPAPSAAAQADCDLALADVLKVAGDGAHQMTEAEFKAWSGYAAKHGAPMQPGMSAYVIQHIDEQDDNAILVTYQGCVALEVHPFTDQELSDLYHGKDIDSGGADGANEEGQGI